MTKIILPIVWTGAEREISIHKELTKRGTQLNLLLLLIGKNDAAVDVKISVTHLAPDTTSRVIVKAVLMDRSRVNFDGLVRIEPGAKNSDTWLEARLLLLSDHASGRAVPNLEIAENEVKAGHAATVGRINEEDLFYIMSRGLPEDVATKLIVRSFLESLLSGFPQNIAEKTRKLLT